jgi:hypothetical protein
MLTKLHYSLSVAGCPTFYTCPESHSATSLMIGDQTRQSFPIDDRKKRFACRLSGVIAFSVLKNEDVIFQALAVH